VLYTLIKINLCPNLRVEKEKIKHIKIFIEIVKEKCCYKIIKDIIFNLYKNSYGKSKSKRLASILSIISGCFLNWEFDTLKLKHL